MSKRFKFTLHLAAASVIALVPAGASLADPGLNDVRPHQHFIVTSNGDWVPVGPDVCADPDLQQAFNQFHFNVHSSALPTLGPQGGAPGLHDDRGAELTAVGCG